MNRDRPRPSLLARGLMLLVLGYRATLSRWLGGQCRFHPTCSAYALDALREHGATRGGLMAARRVLRCRPFGGSGYDPVPPAGREAADLRPGGGGAGKK
jgi:uncharacterized protein